jgi:excisionase family DNA binding protein
MKKTVYTTHDISRICCVNITTVMGWIDAGRLPAYKTPGGHRRVQHRDLLRFLDKFKMPVPPDLAGGGLRVLVVDDDPQVVKFLCKAIRMIIREIEIDAAADGFEAGRKIESFRPDLVILDIFLPGIDGFRVCRDIRSSPAADRIRILAISGEDSPELRRRIRECGADGFLGKPLDLESIAPQLSALLGIERAEGR